MGITRAIGAGAGQILKALVWVLTLTRVHPNVLTSIGLGINAVAAWMLARGEFLYAGLIVLAGAIFDLVDGPVARESNRVTRFGGFLDSVLDRYSDLILLMGLLVYYASINRFFYIILTAIAMTGSVLVSYSRARAENCIPKCKVGFLERPERIVLIIIGALSNHMAPVLWVIAVLSNITVVHRIVYTYRQTRAIDHVPVENNSPAKPDPPKAKEAKAGGGKLREGFGSA